MQATMMYVYLSVLKYEWGLRLGQKNPILQNNNICVCLTQPTMSGGYGYREYNYLIKAKQ